MFNNDISKTVQVLTVILSQNWCLTQHGAIQPLSVFIALNSPWSIDVHFVSEGEVTLQELSIDDHMASYKYCIGDTYVLQVCSNWNNVPTSWLFPEPQDSVLRDLGVHKVCSVHVYIHIVLNEGLKHQKMYQLPEVIHR